jgi:FkbM family methyltransferase
MHLVPDALKYSLFRVSFATFSENYKHDLMAKRQIASMEWSLQNIKRLGFEPAQIVDVGAYNGDWTKMVKAIYPKAKVLMLEAQKGKDAALKQVSAAYRGDVSYQIALLGAESGKPITFYEYDPVAGTGSSVFADNSSIARTPITCTMETLDHIVQDQINAKVDFLKLDVQGYELEILKGSTHLLQNVEVVLMEVSFLPLIEQAPLMHEVVHYMKQQGFITYDICSFIRRPLDQALWQSDFLFVKETSSLLSNRTVGV